MKKMRELLTKNAGISLPIKTWEEIDSARGDVNRSRFILRAIERALEEKKEGVNK